MRYQAFPSNIVAGMFAYHAGEYFEVKFPEEKNAPNVKFK